VSVEAREEIYGLRVGKGQGHEELILTNSIERRSEHGEEPNIPRSCGK